MEALRSADAAVEAATLAGVMVMVAPCYVMLCSGVNGGGGGRVTAARAAWRGEEDEFQPLAHGRPNHLPVRVHGLRPNRGDAASEIDVRGIRRPPLGLRTDSAGVVSAVIG